MAFVEGNADRREVFVHTVFLEGVTILDGICPMAIGRLAMANKELQQLVMQEKRIWLNSIATALPAFELNPELLEKPHKFLPFLRDFRKAIAIPGPERRAKGTDTARSKQSRWTQCPKATHVLRLRRLEDARKLQDRLRIADQIAREHLANGGCYAKVFLAPLVLPEMHNKARFWLEDSDEEGLHSHLAFGQPIVVPADEAPQSDESDTGNRLRQIGDDQVRPCALRIHFVRLQHQLLMAARDDDAPAIMIPLNGPPYHEPRRPSPVGAMRVTVDISVADMKHQLFHVRGITLSVNGPWVDCCGLYAPPQGIDSFAPSDPAPARAALSIICIRDDGVERPNVVAVRAQSETFGTAKLPDALHLDCLRGRPFPR
ncbi:unnamed protein product [Cladocopium goreaui]|uniref:Uncharacterized protein n=1 Tax=Cladocopium goreaui TaxID=2562237 RepID=A0A9P1DQL3_9DINO|nr:unnamed protein product [Cladocopium goreaui]